MYREFYGLKKKPFGKTPDPGMLYLSPGHQEALARMEQAVEDRELMLFTGEIGSGKTTLSRALVDRLGDDYRVALIINPRLSPNQLLRTVAARLGEDKPRYYKSDLIDQVSALLFECWEKQICPVIIIDEAQVIPTRETFEEIRLLTNFQLDQQNLLSMILIGQPELARRLEHPVYTALKQRIGMRFHLERLNREEVRDYMDFRMRQAGNKKKIFNGEAIETLYRYSQGVPRRINNIASAAMLEAFGKGKETITADIIEDAALDLGIKADDDDNKLSSVPRLKPKGAKQKSKKAASG